MIKGKGERKQGRCDNQRRLHRGNPPFEEKLAHYSMSKAGVIALARSLAREYGRNFRVNAIVPGGILTPGVEKAAREFGMKAA